jgi:hypothetical protein
VSEVFGLEDGQAIPLDLYLEMLAAWQLLERRKEEEFKRYRREAEDKLKS